MNNAGYPAVSAVNQHFIRERCKKLTRVNETLSVVHLDLIFGERAGLNR